MKCFLTYDTRQQFRKHLHFKHGEESKACRHCRHRTWPHVYHFCIKQVRPTLPPLLLLLFYYFFFLSFPPD